MNKLLTLDVGTTAVKAGLFSDDLTPLAFAINEYALLTPENDIVEMQPEVYWEKAVLAVKQVLSQTDTSAGEVKAITCTTQGETLIPVDKDGQPLRNAIVWLDARAKSQAARVSELYSKEQFYARTGLPEVNGYCPVAKLLWIKENQPDIYDKTYKFLLLEDYLVQKLSGAYVTNPALMCSTGYFDTRANTVWSEILTKLQLDESKIPEVVPCGKTVGHLCGAAAQSLGLGTDVVVSSGAMDQVAAAIGSGNVVDGVVAESTGTCLAITATVSKPDFDTWSPVTIYSHGNENQFLLITISQTAGMVLKWFRNEFCKDLMQQDGNAFDTMSELALSAPPLSRGVMLFPFLTGMQFPSSDEDARGVFFGVGLDTGRDCFIRSIMEGVSYVLRESIELMNLNPERILALGGGSKSDAWCGIKADICNKNIIVMDVEESASLGAAMLGGVACGIFKDLAGAVGALKHKKEFAPNPQNSRIYESGYALYKKMYTQFKPLFDTKNI